MCVWGSPAWGSPVLLALRVVGFVLVIFVGWIEGWFCFVDSELRAFGSIEAEKKLKNRLDLPFHHFSRELSDPERSIPAESARTSNEIDKSFFIRS